MIKVIRNLLSKLIKDIDAGNTAISEEDAVQIAEALHKITDRTERMSKYKACEYLNISRATFDNYVRAGKLPKGKHTAGFKEISWSKVDLDKFIKENRQ